MADGFHTQSRAMKPLAIALSGAGRVSGGRDGGVI
jgi:hypothetical protein